jgi:ABC-type Fe3+/spermidine/putrescine transport system ATPase subunit
MPPFLVFDRLRKSFGEHIVLSEISLEVQEGEILVLLGPSGSGKTTLLRLISGFESPDRGSLQIGGEDVTPLAPERRNFGMVFQHYALFPHLSVAANIAFGLESRGVGASERDRRVAEVLELVELSGFGDRPVQQISGGQQQRVALARALAPHPRLLLLDEPLSNLDPELRERTRRQLRQAIRRVGLTAVWVTHEQEEAFDVGDRIALLHDGQLAQVGPPERLYLEPRSRFVAAFVGRASFIGGLQERDGMVLIGHERAGGRAVRWPVVSSTEIAPAERVEVMFRPEGLRLCRPEESEALLGVVIERRFTGESTFYLVELPGGERLLVKGELEGPAIREQTGVALCADGPPPRSFVAPREAEGEV